MTERTPSAADDMDADDMGADFDPARAADLELIIDALNGHLSPERVAEVTRRLEEDPAFRDFAAPMLLTWSVPSYLERHPRPVGELETAWSEFAERAGITPPPVQKGWRRHARWKWMGPLLLLLAMLPLVAYVTFARRSVVSVPDGAFIGQLPGPAVDVDAPVSLGPIRRVRYDTTWVPVGGTGIQVRQAPGSDLWVVDRRRYGTWVLVLDSGTVRFRVGPMPSAEPAEGGNQIDVQTRNGIVSAGESEFTVRARGDTTEIEVHAIGLSGPDFRPVLASQVILRGPDPFKNSKTYTIPLAAGERTRLVRDQVPVRVAGTP